MNHVKSFLVGGAVRDILMGLEPKDRDFVVVGSNGSELMAMGYEQVGMGFPVFLHPWTGEEYALARREKKVGAGYTGFEFETGLDVTLEEDLSRRDLTINSMAMKDDMVVDPFGGQRDLEAQVLRHTSDAFAEDPLRVVRLARFFARYDTFTVADETMTLASEMVDRGDLDELPDERFWREMEKAFADGCTARFWELLFEIGALQKVSFFQRLLGDDWRCGRFMHIVRVANSFSKLKSVFTKEELPSFFAAAVAPEGVVGLFNSADAGRVYEALQRVRMLRKPVSALDMHELIMSVRGYSDDNPTLEQLCQVLCALAVAGEFLPVCSKTLREAAVAGRQITAQPFIDFGHKGKAIGDAMALARVQLIETLNL